MDWILYCLDGNEELAPGGPVSRTPNSGHAINLGIGVDCEIGSTHRSFAVDPRHRLHLMHGVLEAYQSSVAVVHASRWEWGEGLSTACFYKGNIVRDDNRAISGYSPEEIQCFVSTEGSKDGPIFVIVDDKGEGALELFEDLMSWHGAAVAQSPVGLDDEEGLIPALCEAVLLVQLAQVVQVAHENAVHVIHPREQAPIWAWGGATLR